MNKEIFDKTSSSPLRFNNGKLRVMHVTDTHLGVDNQEMSMWLIENALDLSPYQT